MANRASRNTYGFNTWPILLSLFTAAILISGFHYYQLSEDGIDLVCEGSSYGEDAADDLDLLLSLETESQLVSLDYQFFRQDKLLGKITFRGTFDTLDVASMTYKLLISEGDFQIGFGQKSIPAHMASIIDGAKRGLEHSKTASLDLHIIDMDSGKGYAVIQFNPGNGIWICDLD
ncbi:hypothetical protein FM038_004420 [Shewanella eurypsychrophilus]|uniref:Uncharacterized protein n=1 Tax=Shewanella eurypsychrophilus TaxID=2593656 RepID=A0ABX6V4Q3_9GAMM|nr:MULTISPECIES: hypothetical protein [Shewanella]QFU21466.1 hypothetical protein FS418_06000 [Shewanella sp. YLB-09]QPG56756.1 hypothetical protein FM038_004420 [Shewanella eurypsychrophilus]